MRAFPMFIKTTGRRVIIVGGGEEAAQKFRLLSKTDAQIVLAAQILNAELTEAVKAGLATQYSKAVTSDVFIDAAMVFIATGDEQIDVAMHGLAKEAGALVNVVDNPPLCDMTTPSIVDRDPVIIAIGTEGAAPVLARLIKTKVEGMLAPNLGKLAKLAGQMRHQVNETFPGKQRAFWAWVFRHAPMQHFARGHDDAGEDAIKSVLQRGQIPSEQERHLISVISTDCQGYDLLTMRAVACLQEADVIYIEPRVDEAILELPRRDARRIAMPTEHSERARSLEDAMERQDKGQRVAIVMAPNSPLSGALRAQASVRAVMHHQGQAN